jgi:hypothetical protein
VKTEPVKTESVKTEPAKTETVPESYYGIQIMGLGRLLKNGDPAFKGLDVNAVKAADSNIYKYVAGPYQDKDVALKMLQDVKRKFPEAFLVKVEGTTVTRLR